MATGHGLKDENKADSRKLIPALNDGQKTVLKLCFLLIITNLQRYWADSRRRFN